MATPPVSDEELAATVAAYNENERNQVRTASALGCSRAKVQEHLRKAAERGLLLGHPAAMPGYKIAKLTTTPHGDSIQQKPDLGEAYKPIDSLALKGRTTWADILPDGSRIATREVLMERADKAAQLEAMRAAVEGFKDKIPRAHAIPPPLWTASDLLCQYTITDVHLGCLAWHEETGGDDYDLTIAEKLLEDWFAAAIDMAPRAKTAVLAQLGDLLHHDSHESVTPAHRNILDADSRFQKMVRVAIRVLRKVISQLLAKHEQVHIIMADANHDPASEAWLREMFAAFYENEPRVTVDNSAGAYYVYRHGDVSLFYTHGHRRSVKDSDTVFAGRFREIYGNTKFSYAHLGHRHNDELKTTNLMKVEQHETLAAPDAYAANKGYISGRSAKVIVYHKNHGEVSRLTLTPEIVAGSSSKPVAANDNEVRRAA